MPLVDILVPQLGEGLTEARILRLLKAPGERVARDEPIYEMETDKAQVEIESPSDGTLSEWLAEEDDVLAIGATIARLRLDSAKDDDTTVETEVPQPKLRIPPRTRAHCKALGISPEQMHQIPAQTNKLMPQDVDAYRAEQQARGVQGASSGLQPGAPATSRPDPLQARSPVDDPAPSTPASRQRASSDADGDSVRASTAGRSGVRPLSARQDRLVRRLQRSATQVVPATIKRPIPAATLTAAINRLAAAHPPVGVGRLEALAYAVSTAQADHPAVRSTFVDHGLRESPRFNLGVAVALPRDELVTAVLTDAGALPAARFLTELQAQVGAAMHGTDQSLAHPHVLLSDMGALGVTDGVPVLVAPATAVLLAGAPYDAGGGAVVNLVLTFDHRVMNGAGAAAFLASIVDALGTGEAGVLPTVEGRGDGPQTALEAKVRAEVADLLGVEASRVDPAVPVRSQGLSSLAGVQLRDRLEASLGVTLPATLVFNYPTVAQIALFVATSRTFPEAAVAPTATQVAEPIAIVGVGCRLPGGVDSLESFWTLLAEGRDAIVEVPADRWDIDACFDAEPGTPGCMSTRCGGFLDRIDTFDHAFFGISRREAASMDPQQRLLLEVAWHALEHGGISPTSLAGSRTGVFVGACFSDYYKLLSEPPMRGGVGTLDSILANRLSYFFDLRGPSLVVDTACSSSLVAIDLACQSLRCRASDTAFAAGVNLILSPEMHITFSHAGMMAPDGRCKTFDAAADGYSRGEGCAVVVLKRLSDARADGDQIFALIRGSAVNQDGASNGISAPNGLAQQAVIRDALDLAGVAPAAVGMIEAHGTGTPLGDPIEVEALKAVYGGSREGNQACHLGSVKTNVGHLEAVAGLAGLLKVVLSLRHGVVPPHLHFSKLNPHIDLTGTPLVIPTDPTPWPEPRRFGVVSSFGVGGTNAHAVLEAAPPPVAPAPDDRRAHLLPLSARTAPALRALAAGYAACLEQAESSIADVCHTAAIGRKHLQHRLAIVTRTCPEAAATLRAFAETGEGNEACIIGAPDPEPPVLGLLVDSAKTDVTSMSALYDGFAGFAAAFDAADAAARQVSGASLLDPSTPAPWRELALRHALLALWFDLGVRAPAIGVGPIGEAATRITTGQPLPETLAAIRAAVVPGAAEPNRAEHPADLVLPVGATTAGAAPLPVVLGAASPVQAVLQTAARLYTAGVDLRWTALDRGVERRRVVLPSYPFERKRCWLEPHEIRGPLGTDR